MYHVLGLNDNPLWKLKGAFMKQETGNCTHVTQKHNNSNVSSFHYNIRFEYILHDFFETEIHKTPSF